jgi:uncharacterized protein (DUF1697 family)
MHKYVAFLRGINVGGHHKVPMAELRSAMEQLNCKKIGTILNSGNVLFESEIAEIGPLEQRIAVHLEKTFGFSIPILLRKTAVINQLLEKDPFKAVPLTKEIRLYVSFLSEAPAVDLSLPWVSTDHSFKIINQIDETVCSVLDLSVKNTPKAMEALEKHYGKAITTRNWNTIKRIEKKLLASKS